MPRRRCSTSSPTWSAIRNSCRLCQSLKVKTRTQEEDGVEVLVADMTVAYKLVRETFTSRVTLDRPKMQILVEYLSGPFSHLQNRWKLSAPSMNEHCDVEFFIEYEFRSRILAAPDGRDV